MRRRLLLLTFIAAVHGSEHVFSVHDDILAFPQYDVIFSDSFISDSDAESRLAYAASSSAAKPRATGSSPREHEDSGEAKTEISKRPTSDTYGNGGGEPGSHRRDHVGVYEVMHLMERQYLCAIPVIDTAPKNETANAVARAEEEKELARATTRGWELLQELQGNCMYFISGWWSYQFCYNAQVKQFHQLPPQKGVPIYPPMEDPTTPSYILGRASPSLPDRDGEKREGRKEISDGRTGVETTELQAKGEMRYLVQKLGAGTVCDLTGKERRIEVQFHCHPQSADRIGWIKEVTTCSYLMIIYTARLCNDVAFLPPRNNKAHPITCQEILTPDQMDDWKARKAYEAEQHLLKAHDHNSQQPEAAGPGNTHPDYTNFIIGGVQIGAKKLVGTEGRRIESGAVAGGGGSGSNAPPGPLQQHTQGQAQTDVVATSEGKAKGGKERRLTDEELKRMNLDPEAVERLKKQVQELAGDKGWTLEITEAPDGFRLVRGIINEDDTVGGKEGKEKSREGGDASVDDDDNNDNDDAMGDEGAASGRRSDGTEEEYIEDL